MAVTYPLDLLADFPGWVTDFDLLELQEQSRSANGKTYVKDLADPLWQMTAQSRQLSPNELDYWRARLKPLKGGGGTFYGYPLSRTYPIRYPNGAWPTGGAFNGVSASLVAVNINQRAVQVGSLPAGFTLSVGDYIAIGHDLHQVMEGVTAAVSGATPEFEVRPNVWPGVAPGSAAVAVKRPSCIMAVVPGSVSSTADPQTGWGSITFQAVEAR